METDKGRRQEERSIDVLSDSYVHTTHIFLVVVIVLSLLLLVCMGVVVYQHKTFSAALQEEHEKYIALLNKLETTETYEYEIEQEADDNSNNVWVGRDFFYGSNSKDAGEDHEDPNP